MNRQEFDSERDAIGQAIDQIISEIGDLSKTVNEAASRIDEGKETYEDALSRGDERAMKTALGKIRQANEDRDAAAATLRGRALADRIKALRARQDAMRSEILPMREAAETAMKTAKAATDDVELCRNRCAGLQGQLNNVTDRLTQARDAVGPKS
jgi:chromosome segregation ATPase